MLKKQIKTKMNDERQLVNGEACENSEPVAYWNAPHQRHSNSRFSFLTLFLTNKIHLWIKFSLWASRWHDLVQNLKIFFVCLFFLFKQSSLGKTDIADQSYIN